MDQAKIREWIVCIKKKCKLTNNDIAEIWGLNPDDPSPVSKSLKGRRKIQLSEYVALANHLRSKKLLDRCPAPLGIDQHEGMEVLKISRFERGGDDGYSRDSYEASISGAIPELDVTVGAGEGTVGEFVQININGETAMGHMVVAEWLFPDGYLQNTMKVSGQHSVVMEVRGDSMDPTVRHGDKVIIDLRINTLGNDGLYLISDGQRAPQIKRLEYVWKSEPPTVKVISDNPSHREIQTMALEELRILGRIAGRVLAF